MKRISLLALAGLLLLQPGLAGVESLSHLFALGKTVFDLDGDGLGERLRLTIVIPDDPTAGELALAADVAARANFESLALDFGLVKRRSEVAELESLPFPILIGSRLPWVRDALRERGAEGRLEANQGLVFVFGRGNRSGLACTAGSDQALLETGRAFFLRWPYFWEIWGRETGATYFSLESDLARFLKGHKVPPQKTIIREALYEFPVRPAAKDALQGLAFDQGQIRNLTVEAHFAGESEVETARDALSALRREQRRGMRTEILSYPGCARITFELRSGRTRSDLAIARTGSTKRLLTPSYKERPGPEPAGKTFDILEAASAMGFYSDQDGDGIMDGLDASVVISGNAPGPRGLAALASRLVLDTAGAAFPVVVLDSEVESRKALAAPILVGDNALTRDLVKTGKLKPPPLDGARGLVRVVPGAFGKSAALVVFAPGAPGLEKTLEYFSQTFPYFDDYGEGHPAFKDVAADFQKFLKGGKGAAEAWLLDRLKKAAAEIEGKDLESLEARVLLPAPNRPFEEKARALLTDAGRTLSPEVSVATLRDGKTVFEKEESFSWEADDAMALIRENIPKLEGPVAEAGPVEVSLGISESPAVRAKIRCEIEAALAAAGLRESEVEVLSAYKPGFSWLTERVLPRLKALAGVHHLLIRFSENPDDVTVPKRTHAEPARWLQELYPVDEILARDLNLPLERVEFEMKDPGGPIYDVRAFREDGTALFEDRFTPPARRMPLFDELPEWGAVEVTEGWLRLRSRRSVILDGPLTTDLEKFWAFYQREILKPLCAHIRKKTGDEPTFSKQPYFKRLQVELWASEPDYRLGLDEEIVSSLESLHDEIYFDTLDLLRGVTRFDPEDKDLPPDTSRSSAPGNVLPRIHPSLEGGPCRVKVSLEDWTGSAPELILVWKEKGREPTSKKYGFPVLKPKAVRFPGFVYDGEAGRVEDLFVEADWEKEADFLALLDILEAYRGIAGTPVVGDPFVFPNLGRITVRLGFQDREKDEALPVVPAPVREETAAPPPPPDGPLVPTRDIIPPETVVEIAGKLGRFDVVRSYSGGTSYEGREVPVLEIYLPAAKYVSLPRLITFKPTLQLSARQHANEVSSTNYLLRFAELTARDPAYRGALKKMNFVLQPMENPDGAALAFELQKIEHFHSLHAGRYGSLGVDIGYQLGSKPLLPEAAVRPSLYDKWRPDIYLNLHGYPSHEWVQQFSNYTPYLFREYWVPKGWFAYFRTLSLPIYRDYRDAGRELLGFVARELQSEPGVPESNRKFYDRYRRWAGRWAPHMDVLEIHGGVNIFTERRSSTENKLSPRTRTTFVEETPELMDETAAGAWLDVLCRQGLAYLRAHVKYLERAEFAVVRVEEETRDRVRLTFLRGRPAPARKDG